MNEEELSPDVRDVDHLRAIIILGAPTVAQRIQLAEASDSPSILALLAADREWVVKSKVADNPATAPAILSMLAVDLDSAVRMQVAANPRTPVDILGRMAATERSPSVCRNLKCNRSLSAGHRLLLELYA